MAVVGQEEVVVEVLSISAMQSTGRGNRFMTLQTRRLDDSDDRLTVTLWNQPAVEFQKATSWMKPSGKAPLHVRFDGRFRKKESYCARRDAKHEVWEFNAKGFVIDERCPAAMQPKPANLTVAVDAISTRESASGVRQWTFSGTRVVGKKTMPMRVTLAGKPGAVLAERARAAAQGEPSAERPVTIVFAGQVVSHLTKPSDLGGERVVKRFAAHAGQVIATPDRQVEAAVATTPSANRSAREDEQR